MLLRFSYHPQNPYAARRGYQQDPPALGLRFRNVALNFFIRLRFHEIALRFPFGIFRDTVRFCMQFGQVYQYAAVIAAIPTASLFRDDSVRRLYCRA